MTATARIIAATDLTPRSAAVPERALLLGQALGAEVLLVHVRGAPPDSASGRARPLRQIGGKLAALPRAARPADPAATLKELAQAAATQLRLSTPPQTQVIDGPVDRALADLTHAEGALLLVLGLHRERRALDILRLTTMERVVLSARSPVLIAHRRPVQPYRRVLGSTDFAPASVAAMAMAARLVPDARFHAVHALQLPLGASFIAGGATFDAALTQAELLRSTFEAAAGMPKLAEPTLIVPGTVHEVLAFRQGELDADLICVGTHSGRDPDVLGNYARDLMRAPPTDLLVAKPG
jgi:nucleotide-binding universal stress UspA family protein